MARAPSTTSASSTMRAGRGIRLVVDARDAGVVVDVRLRVAVGLERAVPLEVVVGEVQAHARVRRDRVGPALQARGTRAGGSRARRRARRSRPGRARRRAPGCRCCRPGAARRPPSTSIVAVSRVVVVLPFVPVMRTQSAGEPSARTTLSRTRQASSMSPHTAMPDSCAHAMTGCRGAKPGRGDDHLGGERRRAPRGTVVERADPQPRADHGQQPLVLRVGATR